MKYELTGSFPFVKKEKPKPKFNLKIASLIAFFLFLLLLLIIFFINLGNVNIIIAAAREAKQAKSGLVDLKSSFLKYDSGIIYNKIDSAQTHFQNVSDDLGKVRFFPNLKFLRNQVNSVKALSNSGIAVISSLKKIYSKSEAILGILKQKDPLTYNSVSSQDKEAIVRGLSEMSPDLIGIKAQLNLTLSYLSDDFQKLQPIGIIKSYQSEFNSEVNKIIKVLDNISPIAQTLPALTGYPNDKTYLVIMQNNMEMRASGGFIGTYGIVKFSKGSLTTFWTDNIYNLDDPSKDKLNVPTPWPFKEYMNQDKWYMRDANWYPDFPDSAKKVEWFYHQEGGKEENIDGIIAFDPNFIGSLLKLTGEVEVDKVKFNTENVAALLEYEVEEKYVELGLDQTQRKQIIGKLGERLINIVSQFPPDRFLDLYNAFESNIKEKHLLAYLKQSGVQNLIDEQGWGGRISNAPDDYLMVVDSNFASLKTDAWVKKDISYSVKMENHGLIARAEISYDNQRTADEPLFSNYATRYRTFTRVYVPQGSRLLSVEGAMKNDGSPTDQAEVLDEFGKTRFGAFISVEPKEKKSLVFNYALPGNVLDQINKLSYNLLIQKQAGTSNNALKVDVILPFTIKSIEPTGFENFISGNTAEFKTDLLYDRKFIVNL